MIPQEVAPRSVPELGRPLGRTDDVGEQDRGQDGVGHRLGLGTGKEHFDLARHRLENSEPNAVDLDGL